MEYFLLLLVLIGIAGFALRKHWKHRFATGGPMSKRKGK